MIGLMQVRFKSFREMEKCRAEAREGVNVNGWKSTVFPVPGFGEVRFDHKDTGEWLQQEFGDPKYKDDFVLWARQRLETIAGQLVQV